MTTGNRIKKTVDMETRSVTLSFPQGEGVYCLDNLSEDMVIKLALHGLSRKLGDSYTSISNRWRKIGLSLSFENAMEVVNTLWKSLENGDWGERSSGLEAKLKEARAKLAEYDAFSDKEKRVVARFVNRGMLVKEIAKIEKAIARRDAKA